MQRTALSPARLAIIAGFALSCFGLLLFLWIAFGGTTPLKPKGYRFEAGFPDAATLAEQADVRIAGVSVGKVVAKRRAPEGNRTLATIEIEPEYAPLHRDARAILRQKTLLGETYVQMTIGSRDAPELPEGARLDNVQVAETVEFDELLQIFDPQTREAFQRWQATTRAATEGKARDLSDALGHLPEFTEGFGGVVGVLERRRAALRGLVRGTGDTFAALTRNEGALEGLIVNQERAMRAIAGEREALAQTIQIFPTFLRESRATLDRLRTFSAQTEPLVRELEPVLRDVEPTFAALAALSPDLENLFADLRPLIAAGEDGLPALSRVLRGLDPTLAELGPFLSQLNPILQWLELNQASVADFLNTGPSALNLKLTPPASGFSLGHALPQLIVTGSQSTPANARTSDNRGNSYIGPGALTDGGIKDPARFSHPSWDCANAGGPRKPDEENPGCYVADPIRFKGSLRRFPHVERGGRGGG